MSGVRSSMGALAVLALSSTACGPDIEPQRQSNRHLAAEYCSYAISMHEECGGLDFTAQDKQERQERCEADIAWDWTDHCAERVSAWVECTEAVTCEGWRVLGHLRDVPGRPRSPCAEEGIARFGSEDCKAYDNGVEIDHGQDSG